MADIPGQVVPITDDTYLVKPLWYEFLSFVFRSIFGQWRTDFKPTFTAQAGTPICTGFCRYRRTGHTVDVSYDITITNANGASGALVVTLPVTAIGAFIFTGREVATNGSSVTGTYAGTAVAILYYNNSTVITTGNRVWMSGTYEV